MATALATKQVSELWPRHWPRNQCQRHGLYNDEEKHQWQCRGDGTGKETGVSDVALTLATTPVSASWYLLW